MKSINLILKKIDAVTTGGKIKRLVDRIRVYYFYKKIESSSYDRVSYFAINSNKNELNSLFEYYGSDKGTVNNSSSHLSWPIHSYGEVYDLIFSFGRLSVNKIVECGIGTNNPNLRSSMGINGKPGASLRAWRDYFTYAKIVGCDIDPNILFTEERIETYHCDQTDPLSIAKFRMAANLKSNTCDIIIDDGLHEFNAGVCFFNGMIDSLKKSGVYIIEDVRPDDAIRYAAYFSNQNYRTSICDMPRRDLALGYNTIVIVKHGLINNQVQHQIQ